MFTGKNQIGNKIVVAVILCFSLMGGWVKPVRAETLTWTGNMSSAWNSIGNWSPNKIPTTSDAVFIPSTTTNDPTIPVGYSAVADSITIQNGGQLTISNNGILTTVGLIIEAGGELVTADQSETSIYLSGAIENHGNILNRGQLIIFGFAGSSDGMIINSGNYASFTPSISFWVPFNNAGTVDIQNGYVWLIYGGTHTGTFSGSSSNTGNWAGLWLGSESMSGQTFTFLADSAITLPRLVADGDAVVNIFGTYTPAGTSELRVWGTSAVTFDLPFDGSVNTMADDVAVASTLYLIGSDGFLLSELFIDQNGQLVVNDTANIVDVFHWDGGVIAGSGTTTVDASATTFSIYAWPHTLNGHSLINNADADWESGNIAVINGATFVNNGTFTTLATTTMTGTAAESFINDGFFTKDIAGTTTTMDIPFTNNGTVDVVAGSLVFQQGMENGENTIINLGDGVLDPGDTLNLENGDSLIGSGTLAANLVNAGTVSPGESPGIITIDGDYTQEADGVLEIQLGGTTPGTGFDQLIVTGTATMQGTLNVSLIPGFTPILGDTFVIIDHTTGTLTFDTVNLPVLPGGLQMEIDFSDDGVTLTVVGGAHTYIFLPLIVK